VAAAAQSDAQSRVHVAGSASYTRVTEDDGAGIARDPRHLIALH
jgi:hypothetical protein